jgi:hypothetical protein
MQRLGAAPKKGGTGALAHVHPQSKATNRTAAAPKPTSAPPGGEMGAVGAVGAEAAVAAPLLHPVVLGDRAAFYADPPDSNATITPAGVHTNMRSLDPTEISLWPLGKVTSTQHVDGRIVCPR